LYCRPNVHPTSPSIVHSYRSGLQRRHNTKLRPFRPRVSVTCSFDIQGGFLVRPCRPCLLSVSLLLLCLLLTSPMRSGSIALPSALFPSHATSQGTWETSQGNTQNFITRKRRIYKAHPNRGWRTLRSRARSSRVCHTSYPVPVRLPVRCLSAAPTGQAGTQTGRPALLDRASLPAGRQAPDPASRRRPCPSPNLRLHEHLVQGLSPC